MITVLLRYEHHIDHTFLQATHYQDQGGVLTVHCGEEEVACFPAGSWDGVYLPLHAQPGAENGRR